MTSTARGICTPDTIPRSLHHGMLGGGTLNARLRVQRESRGTWLAIRSKTTERLLGGDQIRPAFTEMVTMMPLECTRSASAAAAASAITLNPGRRRLQEKVNLTQWEGCREKKASPGSEDGWALEREESKSPSRQIANDHGFVSLDAANF
jgi:hypothetical protein